MMIHHSIILIALRYLSFPTFSSRQICFKVHMVHIQRYNQATVCVSSKTRYVVHSLSGWKWLDLQFSCYKAPKSPLQNLQKLKILIGSTKGGSLILIGTKRVKLWLVVLTSDQWVVRGICLVFIAKRRLPLHILFRPIETHSYIQWPIKNSRPLTNQNVRFQRHVFEL